jgi:signal transduction histidine kinase
VATAGLSAVIGNFLFSFPYQSLAINSHEEFLDMLFFLLVSVVIGILCEISLRALIRARQAEADKDNFMAAVAHEMRSPLSVIYYASTLSRHSDSNAPKEQLDIIDRQVHNLSLMIEDLLDVSRIARGKIRLDQRPVDAAAIVEGAVERAQPLIERHGHKLQVQVAPRPMGLCADRVRMEQVVANLLTNAAKYTPDGGEIVVRVDADSEDVVFSVRDNGIGIPPELLPRVFDLFVQADTARDRSEGGLGIGLALVRKIAEMHGGTVRAVSEGAGRGSEFIVSVPLAGPAAVWGGSDVRVRSKLAALRVEGIRGSV